jgi:hypothetical protein
MATIINSFEGKRLYDLDKFHSMLSDDYLTDTDNLQTKFILNQFFKGDSAIMLERLALLNLSYSLPSTITEKFADYVGQPETSLEVDLDDFVSAFIWGGMSIFVPRVVKVNGKESKWEIDYASPDQYVLEDDGTERLLTYYEVAGKGNSVLTYILEQTYVKNIVTRVLYKVNKKAYNKDYSITGDVVDLNSIAATAGILPTETFEKIDSSPLVKVHNRKLTGIKYGTSEIKKVRSLISSIEVEAMNIQDQFLKHLQAKLAMPAAAQKIDKDGKINVRDLEVIGMEAGDVLPSYIMNANPLIDKSFQQIEDFLRQICAILTIPTEFLGLKDAGGAESAQTKQIRMVSFIKKIEKIRSKFNKGLIELNEIKKKWSSEKVDETLTISWPSIFPDDQTQLANQLQIAQDAKLISNKQAIMRYQGLDEKEAEEEQEIINKEHATIDTEQIPN